MAKIRFSALEELAHRKPLEVPKRRRVSEILGCAVLTIEKMRQYLSIEAFKKLEKVMIEADEITRQIFAHEKMRKSKSTNDMELTRLKKK